jgi:arylsulfatase A-like enzyme
MSTALHPLLRLWTFLSFLAIWVVPCFAAGESRPPNVILVLTDDQGYGDLSCHGNPVVRTPHLDRLHAESIRFTNFHVAPMCTPTRGQLLTGRDALRNGAMNVSSGRSMVRRDLRMLPEHFRQAGYATGLFGKWHLGDAPPYRPEDRGFDQTVWFPSSHIGALPDHWDNDYFDDIYLTPEGPRRFSGYTTDVFFGEAITWIKQTAGKRPFLCVIPTAAPHWPHYVPSADRERVLKRFKEVRSTLPPMTEEKASELIRFLAMIENIDTNLGRLEAFLQETGLRDDTVVIFLTDNGSTFGDAYFPAGMRGRKATLWEGGHRVPLFVRWPARGLNQGRDVSGLTQVQDLLPTLLDLCGIRPEPAERLDGISLAPVLLANEPVPDRMLVINYSRMPLQALRTQPDSPAVPRREGAAVLWKDWRLLEDRELYDLSSDPLQTRNVIDLHPEVAARMRRHLDAWWGDVGPAAAELQPSWIGLPGFDRVRLTACEWQDVFMDQQLQIRVGQRKNGTWHVALDRAGLYRFELRRFPPEAPQDLDDPVEATPVTDGILLAGPALPIRGARIRIAGHTVETQVAPGARSTSFDLLLPAGRTTLDTAFLDAQGAEVCGAFFVEVTRLGDDTARSGSRNGTLPGQGVRPHEANR